MTREQSIRVAEAIYENLDLLEGEDMNAAQIAQDPAAGKEAWLDGAVKIIQDATKPDFMSTRLDYEDIVWDDDIAIDGERAFWSGYQCHVTAPVLGAKYAWSVVTLPDRELIGSGSSSWKGNCRVDAVSAMFNHWRKVNERPGSKRR